MRPVAALRVRALLALVVWVALIALAKLVGLIA